MSKHPILPWRLAPLSLLLIVSGCAVTRVDPPAAEPAPAQFKGAALWQAAEAAPATPTTVPNQWWQLFNDPELHRLQGELVAHNPSLQALAAQVAQAKALLDASQAARSPVVGLGLGATRSDSGRGNGGNSGSPSTSVQLSANAAWEVDLWGRLSQATEVTQARFAATEFDLKGARLSAQATLTDTYLGMRAAEAQEALLARSLTVYERSLELAQARYQSGVTARTDVLQAQTQLRTTQIQHAEARTQRALFEHALATLTGQPASAVALSKTATLPAVPGVPPLLPAELLARRPDIAASTERVKAAYTQIGVQEAALLPALTLSGSVGYRGPELRDLLTAPYRLWSFGPELVQSLLDGGARRAATAQARAAAEQASAIHRQTVLNALVEVEDNLVLASQLKAQAALQQEAIDYARHNLQITEDQYRVGTVSYVNVVLAQATALSSERNLLDLQTRQLAATTQLLKNIAGAW